MMLSIRMGRLVTRAGKHAAMHEESAVQCSAVQFNAVEGEAA
jgi:hypothetical protein